VTDHEVTILAGVLAPIISLCKPLRMYVRYKLLCSVHCVIARVVPL
jgi:hypothetical protein